MEEHTKIDDLEIIENALTDTEQCQLNSTLSKALWRYGWPIHPNPFSRPCWHIFIAGSERSSLHCCERELADHEQWGFLINVWRRLRSSSMKNSRLIGVYANGQTAGQDGPIHRDNDLFEPGRTAVLFCNDYWAMAWGGELTFFNPMKTDVTATVLPKPNRVVVFNGKIPHRANSPFMSCDRLRMTIAFKTVDQDIGHE